MEKLKQQILDLCNSSGLPLECIVYVLKDAWRDADDTLRSLLMQQEQPQNKEEQKENE